MESLQQVADVICNTLWLDDYNVDEDNNIVKFNTYGLSFEFLSISEPTSCEVYYNGNQICNIIANDDGDFNLQLQNIKAYGFYSFEGEILKVEDLKAEDRQNTYLNDTDDEEEDLSNRDWEDENTNGVKSIVPDDITKIRVVALKLDDTVLAYRFKSDRGSYDMRRSVALKYGLGDFKVSKMIRLHRVNGLLMTDGEHANRILIPDVSDCEVDCKKLMKFMFELN
jgi:hypothetical protein